MLMKIFLILYILNKKIHILYIIMDEIKNDITLLKYIYEKANDSNFIQYIVSRSTSQLFLNI